MEHCISTPPMRNHRKHKDNLILSNDANIFKGLHLCLPQEITGNARYEIVCFCLLILSHVLSEAPEIFPILCHHPPEMPTTNKTENI